MILALHSTSPLCRKRSASDGKSACRWRFENGVETLASAASAYLGNPQRVDPESAFVAELSSCHMLTFLALASNKGFVVDSYDDNAIGRLEKNASGKLAVTRVELRPRIVYGEDKRPTQADLECTTRHIGNASSPIQ